MKVLFGLIVLLLIALCTGIPAFGGIMLLVIALWVVYLLVKLASYRPPLNIKLDVTHGHDSEDYTTYIAGVNYRCRVNDIGGFIGVVRPDPKNKHDKNALAIYRSDGKHVGFIPRSETRYIRGWCRGGEAICIGYIVEGDDAPVYGNVKVYSRLDNRAMADIAGYAKWLINTFGVRYAPQLLNKDKSVRGSAAWHALLDDIIAENERALTDN